MECLSCGRYAPPDLETGYDADELCPECASRDDETLDPARLAEQSILMAIEALVLEVERARSVPRALELSQMLGDCIGVLQTLQDRANRTADAKC